MKKIFESLNFNVGCNKRSDGCKNCIAEQSLIKLAGNKKQKTHTYFRKALKRNIITDKQEFNGELIHNPHWSDPLEKLRNTPIKFLLSYYGEVADYTIEDHVEIAKILIQYPINEYIYCTKKPLRLEYKLKKAEEILNKQGLSFFKENPQIVMAASVESNKYKYRIKNLKEVNLIDRKQIFLKPMINSIINVDYKGIEAVRINMEKGNHERRKIKEKWILAAMREAFKSKTKIHLDMTKNELDRLIKKKIITTDGLTEMFEYINRN